MLGYRLLPFTLQTCPRSQDWYVQPCMHAWAYGASLGKVPYSVWSLLWLPKACLTESAFSRHAHSVL